MGLWLSKVLIRLQPSLYEQATELLADEISEMHDNGLPIEFVQVDDGIINLLHRAVLEEKSQDAANLLLTILPSREMDMALKNKIVWDAFFLREESGAGGIYHNFLVLLDLGVEREENIYEIHNNKFYSIALEYLFAFSEALKIKRCNLVDTFSDEKLPIFIDGKINSAFIEHNKKIGGIEKVEFRKGMYDRMLRRM